MARHCGLGSLDSPDRRMPDDQTRRIDKLACLTAASSRTSSMSAPWSRESAIEASTSPNAASCRPGGARAIKTPADLRAVRPRRSPRAVDPHLGGLPAQWHADARPGAGVEEQLAGLNLGRGSSRPEYRDHFEDSPATTQHRRSELAVTADERRHALAHGRNAGCATAASSRSGSM